MKKLLLFLAAFFACGAISQAQMNNFQTATLTAACTNANTTCAGIAGSQLNVSSVGFNVASVTIHGTYTGVTLNFDVSDDGGTTWYADTCTRGDSPIQETSEAVTNSAIRQWDCGVSGTSNFRVRNNAIASGSDIIGITLSVSNIEPASTVSISGSFTTTLGAGSNVIGKVGIDQTTPGTTNAVQDTNFPSTVDTNSGAKSASTLRVVLATDQPQLTNKLLVTPDSVALPANQSVNVSQVAGTTTDTNSGAKSAGTMRVVLATDQPQLTNKLLVTPDSVALPANQSVNVSQMNGVNTTMGSGVTGTGVQRVVLATDVALAIGGATISQTVGNGAMAAVDTAGTARPLAFGPFPFDGTNSVQARSASLSNSSPSSGAFTPIPGEQLVEKGPRWTINNTGATSGAQGTASIAAAASKRHVIDCIGFSADSAAAVVAANVQLNIRDGATGAGTVIWFYALSFPTASALGIQEINPQHFCGLNLIGTTNTAMTIEFSAGVTGSIQAVNASGYDIN